MATEFNKQFNTAAEYLQANEEQLEQVTAEVFAELARAALKHPKFPEDLIHRAAIVGEESGELLRACLQFELETDKHNYPAYVEASEAVYQEAIQTAATAIRFLISFKP